MSSDKLTKKQKKALAFRERKGKGKAKASFEDLQNDVPIAEDQDLAEMDNVEAQETSQVVEEKLPLVGESKDKGKDKEDRNKGEAVGKKRKRAQQEEVSLPGKEAEGKKTKKRKAAGGEGVAVEVNEDAEEGAVEKSSKKGKKGDGKQQRFILFVGNLKYTTSKEAVQQHFASCDPTPDVRLMTPKPSTTSRPTAKSKGFAFLEFTNKQGLQQALKLHHSELEGRKINVELTAGGGGKSEHRIAKVKERNKELHEQRKKRVAKQKPSKEGGEPRNDVTDLDRPQRYSATSGFDQAPLNKRTWSVPEGNEEPAKKKRGSKKRPPKSMGTGVNALPVG